jgi:hypothetical protein
VKRRKRAVVIRSQGLAVAIGVGSLLLGMWAFDQAWEARNEERPLLARWLAM